MQYQTVRYIRFRACYTHIQSFRNYCLLSVMLFPRRCGQRRRDRLRRSSCSLDLMVGDAIASHQAKDAFSSLQTSETPSSAHEEGIRIMQCDFIVVWYGVQYAYALAHACDPVLEPRDDCGFTIEENCSDAAATLHLCSAIARLQRAVHATEPTLRPRGEHAFFMQALGH